MVFVCKSVSQSDVDIKPLLMAMGDDTNIVDSDAVISSAKMLSEPVTTASSKQGRGSSLPEPNGIKPRKPCNCTKSQCLKL